MDKTDKADKADKLPLNPLKGTFGACINHQVYGTPEA